MSLSGGVSAPRVSRQSWLILAGAFTAFTIGAGLMHSYAVFLIAFIEEFGWSRGETSIAYSVSQLVAGASSPLVGALVDRLGPRRLTLLGGALLVIGCFGSAFATSGCIGSSSYFCRLAEVGGAPAQYPRELDSVYGNEIWEAIN